MFKTLLTTAVAVLVLAACGDAETDTAAAPAAVSVDDAGERFVKLALALGVHDPDYVDAYQGPEEWRTAATAAAAPLDDVRAGAEALAADLATVEAPADAADEARLALLRKNVDAMIARAGIVAGDALPFDDETRLLYDVVVPRRDLASFDPAVARVEALFPGDGPLEARVDAFRSSLQIPLDKLDAVMDAAIAECRARTVARYDLPETERFRMEFVTEQPWSGYNWYQGDYESLIQINTDFPPEITRAVDLGCHEGYPGHHVWNLFVERDLVKGRNWIEYTIVPLFSPSGLIAEGSANYGIELAFPGDEKTQFERDTLYPLAGLDPALADKRAALEAASDDLALALLQIDRDYLDGVLSAEDAIPLVQKYGVMSPDRAAQHLSFVDAYRGYVVNYSIGRDIVRAHVERKSGGDPAARWEVFETMLTTPNFASRLME